MLCSAVQCGDVLCYALPFCGVLCYVKLCNAMSCYALLCCAKLCCSMKGYAVLCCAVLCYAMLCYAMLSCAMLCCASCFRHCMTAEDAKAMPSMHLRQFTISPAALKTHCSTSRMQQLGQVHSSWRLPACLVSTFFGGNMLCMLCRKLLQRS